VTPEAARRLEEAARAIPGVRDAAAVVRPRERARPLDQLAVLERWRARERGGAGRAAGTPARPGAGPAAAAALIDGGDLPDDPAAPRTLQEALGRAAASAAPGVGTTYLLPDGRESHQSYSELLHDAQRVLAGLRAAGLRPGDPVLFQFEKNRNFVTCLWACILGGFLATPAGTPAVYEDNAATRRLGNAWRLLREPPVLTDAGREPQVGRLAGLWGADRVRVLAAEELGAGPEAADWHPAAAGDLALNLLTSGSTGVPKCVQHPHRTVVAMVRGAALMHGFDERDVGLNWMPLDHVGGVLMHAVRDVFLRCPQVSAKIETFLARPAVWLDWIDRFRATNTWAPNFAFALMNSVEEEVRRGSWDLSSMRLICNGGEAVVSQTAQRFLAMLVPHGLGPDVMRPAWGMSEVASGVIFSGLSRGDEARGVLAVDKRSLTAELEPVAIGDPAAVVFTEVGVPFAGLRLRVAGQDGAPLPEDRIGRLQVTGATVMAGYFDNPEANAQSFTADGWFDTGDLAFIHRGRLTIAGRDKDLIVVNGANYLSHDVESVVESVPGVEVTYAAACGLFDPERGTDRLIVFFAPTTADPADHERTIRHVGRALSRQVGLAPDLVVPVDRERFAKTNSGKVQRPRLLEELLAGSFDDALRAVEAPDDAGGDVPEWFFEPVWRPVPPAGAPAAPAGPCLLLAEGGGLGAELAARIPGPVVVARPAARFARLDAATYELDPDDRAHHDRLVDQVARDHGAPAAVIHGWALTPWPEPAGAADARAQLALGPLSVVHLVQALAARGLTDADLLVATWRGQAVRPGDRLDASKAALSGLVRTAAAEAALRSARLLDVSCAEPARQAGEVLAELGAPADEPVVARRDGERLAPRLRPVPAAGAASRPALEPGGLYLLTGGMGGIGFELARYLLAAFQVRLLLTGRTPQGALPDGRLRELAELGDVRYAVADVADAAATAEAVRLAERAWGRPLAGVLHLAGAGTAATWADLEAHAVAGESPAAFAAMFHAKVLGTWALSRLLRDRPGTPLVLFSSVNGHFGGSSFGAYAAANSFLDGFARAWDGREGGVARCLAWSLWDGVGIGAGATASAAERRGFRAIPADAGVASFLVAMRLERPHLLIGLDGANPHVRRALDGAGEPELEVVMAVSGDVSPERVERELAPLADPAGAALRVVRLPEVPRDADGALDEDALGDQRPYEEPATELERSIASIWGDLLRHPRVGRGDSFFELGGDSLRAVQVMARTGRSIGRDLDLHMLYDHPTVGELAEALEEQ